MSVEDAVHRISEILNTMASPDRVKTLVRLCEKYGVEELVMLEAPDAGPDS